MVPSPPLPPTSCCSRLKDRWKEALRRLGSPETETQVAHPEAPGPSWTPGDPRSAPITQLPP